MELMGDVRDGDWLLRRAGGWTRVDGVAGTGFAAYARILHPARARRVDPADTDAWGIPRTVEEGRWRWEEVASRTGRTMHPLVQWLSLTGGEQDPDLPGSWSVQSPEQGLLDTDLLAVLTEHLAAATATPQELVAGLWTGHGDLHDGSVRYVTLVSDGDDDELPDVPHIAEHTVPRLVRERAQRGPYLEWPGREMILFTTSAAELADPAWPQEAGWGWTEQWGAGMAPQLLWPAGHEWVLASELDWDSTIVAGPAALVAAILADPRLEAYPVGPEDALTIDSDLVNGP